MTGILRDEDTRRPVAGAELSLPHASCRRYAPERTRTDENGRFTLASLPTGHEFTLLEPAEILLGEGEEKIVAVRWRRSGR